MRAAHVIAISAAAHGALFAMLSGVDRPAQVATVQPAVRIERREPSDPIEVIVLPEPAAPHTAAPSQVAAEPARVPGMERQRAKRPDTPNDPSKAFGGFGPLALWRSTPGENEMPAHSAHESKSSTSGIMRMRVPGSGLGVGEGTTARIAAEPVIAHAEPKVSGKLENQPGGRAVINDGVATFDVHRDGTLTITDKPDIDVKLKLPIPHIDPEEIRQDLGKMITDWYKDPYAATKFGRKAEVSRVWMAVPGACDSYGDVWCDDEMAPQAEKTAREETKTGGSILGGNMDLTAYAMRKLGIGDPYRARKQKLADETLDERVARGAKFRTQQLDRSAELVSRTLAELWAREPDPAKRRAALFELWDDCDEGEGPRGEAGQRARAMILGWIGAHLPAGSPGAFTPEELRALNARRTSKQSFTP
jgi:hypothetical protein